MPKTFMQKDFERFVEHINYFVEIDKNTVSVDDINIFAETYTLNFNGRDASDMNMKSYSFIVPFYYDTDIDEEGIYVDNVFTHLEKIEQLNEDYDLLINIQDDIRSVIEEYLANK